jgi:DNA-directed RNA polymerase subunit RPC12/RpoP
VIPDDTIAGTRVVVCGGIHDGKQGHVVCRVTNTKWQIQTDGGCLIIAQRRSLALSGQSPNLSGEQIDSLDSLQEALRNLKQAALRCKKSGLRVLMMMKTRGRKRVTMIPATLELKSVEFMPVAVNLLPAEVETK